MTLGQQLSGALTHELNCLEQLLDVLKLEHDALCCADIKALERATVAKNEALAAQLGAESAREKILSDWSFDSTWGGIKQFIAKCDNREQLSGFLSRLQSLTEQCHANNRINGRLIRQKQDQASNALNVIRQTGNTESFYSGQGKTTATQINRSLGKA